MISGAKTANIVRAINHGTFIQLLCADEGGLLSVYLSHQRFSRLHEKALKARVKLRGLKISYDGNIVQIPVIGRI